MTQLCKNRILLKITLYLFIILFLICVCCSCKKENKKELYLAKENSSELISALPENSKSLNIPYLFYVKAAPSEIVIECEDEMLYSAANESGTHTLVSFSENMMFKFSSSGYLPQYISSKDIPILLRKNILQVKLESESSKLKLIKEIATGSQPKSVVFSYDNKKIFVPLLDEKGVDVFLFLKENKNDVIKFETRLKIPNGDSKGFVEGLVDKERKEFWVSNMNDNSVYIFDSETLAYKTSVYTEGIMSKVISQSPDGKIIAVSNWNSRDISFINAELKKLLFKISLDLTPRGMVFSPDSSLLYVAIFDNPVIAVIDIYKRKVIKYFTPYNGNGAFRHILYRDNYLYVSDMARGRLNIVSAEDGKLIRSAYIGSNLNTIVFSPDKKFIFVSSRGKNNPEDYTIAGREFGSVSVLLSDNLSLIERVWGRNQPTGLDISPDGKYMVFSDFLDANLELYEIGDLLK